jgi:2-C-methyl-D-erythritol 4-phosphate cytidylyltransferase
MQAVAIVVAAGRGERMGAERPKAFLELGGEPLLLRAARAFEAAPSVGTIVAVVPELEIAVARERLAALQKLLAVVAGGERRQDSVLAGLRQVPADFDGVVLVHDAARPLVDVELIEAVAQQAAATGAALPVLPLVDTVKRVRGGRVVETLDRAELGGAQTPQGFRFALLREACEAALRAGVALTDEAMAVERLGHPVFAVPGSKRNRKITSPDDLAWAESVVAGILRT